MQPSWWEGIAAFLCKFWWLVLTVIIIAVVLYLTRNSWLPLLGMF